jgi:glutathione S-transferase
MELYYAKGACSLAPHIVLCEVGAPHELSQVPLDGTQKKPEYLKINPKGSVPALKMENGQVLTEGVAIMQYIADKYPDKKLIPAFGTLERYRAMEWLNFISTEMHKGIGAFFGYARLSNPQTKADMTEMMTKRIHGHFDLLASHLSKNTFLMGDQFTVADAYLFTVMNWCKGLKMDLTPWPALMGFMEKVGQRPGVQTALKSEGLA